MAILQVSSSAITVSPITSCQEDRKRAAYFKENNQKIFKGIRVKENLLNGGSLIVKNHICS